MGLGAGDFFVERWWVREVKSLRVEYIWGIVGRVVSGRFFGFRVVFSGWLFCFLDCRCFIGGFFVVLRRVDFKCVYIALFYVCYM